MSTNESKTVLITGAAGFTGRHLVAYLAAGEQPLRLVGADRAVDPPEGLDEFVELDMADPDAVAALVERCRPRTVIHLAAVTPPCRDADLWHVNVGGTNHLLRSLHAAGCADARVLLVGSAAEYLDAPDGCFAETQPVGGETRYGQSKWAQVRLALDLGAQLGLQVVVVRPFNLVGPGLPARWVTAELCRQFADPGRDAVTIGNTASERDFVDVRDAVRAYWRVAEAGRSGEAYNVCSGRPTRIAELIDIFAELTDGAKRIEVDESRFRRVDLDRVYGTIDKIRDELDWEPRIELRQSLADMLRAQKVENGG